MSHVQVILLEQFNRLGKIGDIVSVRRGYARNYLLPRNLALPATRPNRARFDQERAKFEQRSTEAKVRAEGIYKEFNGKRYPLARQASHVGALYGSVTARDITSLLRADGIELGAEQVVIRDRIKELGSHDITLALYADVTATISVVVARSYSEAQQAIKEAEAEEAADKAKASDGKSHDSDNTTDGAEEIDTATTASDDDSNTKDDHPAASDDDSKTTESDSKN